MKPHLDAIILRYIGYSLVFALCAYLLYLVRGALPVFFIAGLIAYALEPVLRKLERRGYSRSGAVRFVFLLFLLLFMVMLGLLASAWQQAQALIKDPEPYQKSVVALAEKGRQRLEEARLPRDVKQSILEAGNNALDNFKQKAPQKLQDIGAWMIGSLGSLVILLVVMPIVTLWIMLEMNAIRGRLLMLVPPEYRRDVMEISSSINELLGRYVRGQIIVCSLYGALCTVAFYGLHLLYGMNYPLVLGLIAAVMYIVPYVGMATIATAAGLTAYVTADAPLPCALAAVGSCLLFNLIIDYGVSPRVLGQGVGLHPLMVIFALLSGAQLAGILGMVFAVPLFASLRVILIYLFPRLSAPIPDTPPEAILPPGANVTSEVVQQTVQAEAAAPPALTAAQSEQS